MAAPSLQTVQNVAAQTGYQPSTIEKVLRLLEILEALQHDPALGGKLALKGGTALNVFHLGLDRLSVDIDLNYIHTLDVAAMRADRPLIDGALERLLASLGYQTRAKPPEHAGRKFFARYASVLGGGGTVEVDINYMHREPLFGVSRLDSAVLGPVQARGILVVDVHEVVAGKLAALFSRTAARDLFDARRILDMPALDWARIRPALIAMGGSGPGDWRQVSVERIAVEAQELAGKLTICLPAAYFAGFGGPLPCIGATVALCRDRLAPLVAFTAAERAFLDGVEDRAEVDAALLTADADLGGRLQRMPALAWKCLNRRKWLAGECPGTKRRP